MPTYEELLRQNIGLPIQQGAQQVGQAADSAIQQKLKALQQVSAVQQPQQPAALPGSSMSPEDQISKAQAMAQAPINQAALDAHFRAMADQEAADQARREQEEREFDPSQYSDYKNVGGRYQKIKKSLKGQEDGT